MQPIARSHTAEVDITHSRRCVLGCISYGSHMKQPARRFTADDGDDDDAAACINRCATLAAAIFHKWFN